MEKCGLISPSKNWCYEIKDTIQSCLKLFCLSSCVIQYQYYMANPIPWEAILKDFQSHPYSAKYKLSSFVALE